ncbi:MAG TPA: hypothetical protein DEA47_00840 [Peptococcaceae bacterium]|nr:MAG: hypothetical protein XD50_1619 [Clostridia bacterium 41_269]HBT19913.1 hypothetical protein [Peptococcaceae bacterium]
MNQVCPVCNGMAAFVIQCPECGKPMDDQGHISDFYGPYSPYEEDLWPQLTGLSGRVASSRCIHFLYCSRCRIGRRRAVKKILI